MITRSQIYSNEAEGLLRAVTMYGSLYETQLYRLYPQKQAAVKNLLTFLTRQKRLYYNKEHAYYTVNHKEDIDQGMIAAFWVLLDLIDKVDDHLASDFPVKICFFAASNHYEIIYVSTGYEAIINHAMSVRKNSSEYEANHIIIVECTEQIELIDIPNTSGFCTVSKDGEISYYKRE